MDGDYARISVNCLAQIPASDFYRNLDGIDMTLTEEWHTLCIKQNDFHKLAEEGNILNQK